LKGGRFVWLAVIDDLEPRQVGGQQFGADWLDGEREDRFTQAHRILALANADLRSQRSPRYDRNRRIALAKLLEDPIPPDLAACQVTVKPDIVSCLPQSLRYGIGPEPVRPRIGKKDLHWPSPQPRPQGASCSDARLRGNETARRSIPGRA
jgi:hypothetical protein